LNGVLIDSDVLVEVSRGRNPPILEQWRRLSESDTSIFCSPVTVAELWHGVRTPEEPILLALFRVVPCLPVDFETGRQAGAYLRQFAKSHAVELGDALIAAASALHGLSLWTRNRRHYPMSGISFY
jgi:predicted nucleic acid-binding protein